eukprot:2727817-Prymnesium_polylepis.1
MPRTSGLKKATSRWRQNAIQCFQLERSRRRVLRAAAPSGAERGARRGGQPRRSPTPARQPRRRPASSRSKAWAQPRPRPRSSRTPWLKPPHILQMVCGR